MARTDVDIEQYISNINWNAGEWQQYIEGANTYQLDADIQEAIHNMLIANFVEAMNQIEEYQEGPLREHLIDMLVEGSHVYVSGGQVRSIFNVQHAGNYEDVVAGQVAAGADFSVTPQRRSAGWRVIYNMANHGMAVPRSVADRYTAETYGEIIEDRLAHWGQKAPYWIFIEFGTAGAGSGPGTPYPSFSGKNPIYKTQQHAKFLAKSMREAWYDSIDETLSGQVEEVFVEERLSFDYIDSTVQTTWTRSFQRGRHMVQLEQLRGRFTGRYRITGPAE